MNIYRSQWRTPRRERLWPRLRPAPETSQPRSLPGGAGRCKRDLEEAVARNRFPLELQQRAPWTCAYNTSSKKLRRKLSCSQIPLRYGVWERDYKSGLHRCTLTFGSGVSTESAPYGDMAGRARGCVVALCCLLLVCSADGLLEGLYCGNHNCYDGELSGSCTYTHDFIYSFP